MTRLSGMARPPRKSYSSQLGFLEITLQSEVGIATARQQDSVKLWTLLPNTITTSGLRTGNLQKEDAIWNHKKDPAELDFLLSPSHELATNLLVHTRATCRTRYALDQWHV